MRYWIALTLTVLLVTASGTPGQGKPSTKWEELTAADFKEAIAKAQGTCLLPFGILEKHGPHLPLGTDLLDVRYIAEHAAQQEYAVIFPDYFAGQIFEARHEPGTIAYSPELQLRLLQETTDEMARNGCKKVVIINGHGGNEHLLPFFAQTQLYKPHDYVVYVQSGHGPSKKAAAERAGPDYHAGETETSIILSTHPDLVHLDRANQESGADQKRVKLPENVYTGIWWYARFPDHYAGDGSTATKEEGDAAVQNWINTVVRAIQAIKADNESQKLQNEFYERSMHPLDTPQ
jgi:creatinine amidohydrolase